jgi:hypothetical protein
LGTESEENVRRSATGTGRPPRALGSRVFLIRIACVRLSNLGTPEIAWYLAAMADEQLWLQADVAV